MFKVIYNKNYMTNQFITPSFVSQILVALLYATSYFTALTNNQIQNVR